MLNSAIGGGNPGCLIKPATLVLLTPSTAINSVSPSTGGSFRLATPGRSGSMTRHLRDRVASGPPAAAHCTTSTVGETYSAPCDHVGECSAPGGDTLSLIHISEPTRRTPNSYAVFCLK